MKPVRRAVLVAFGLLLLFAVSASEALAQWPTQDSVSGTGSAVGTGHFTDIVVDAHSGPGGANPSGTVSFQVFIEGVDGFVLLTGPVTCLAVDGNRALLGFTDIGPAMVGPSTVEIVDNESTGLPDTFFTRIAFTDCLSDPPPGSLFFGGSLYEGDFVVREALTTRGQCMKGGWRDYNDEHGQLFFKNQGDCIQFVNVPA
jgi:hypothetical protein